MRSIGVEVFDGGRRPPTPPSPARGEGKGRRMAKDTTGRLHVTVKSGGKRKLSSKLWLERQLNDPYVVRAKREGFRSRAAFKLTEINDKFHLLKPGMTLGD